MTQAAAVIERGTQEVERRCGARTKSGKPCRQPRGARTSHPGWGRCSWHGGASPNGEAAAAKEAAMHAARQDYLGEVELSPLDALLYTVRRGAQLVAYWQRVVATADDERVLARAQDQEAKALADLNAWADRAVKAGVSKLQVEIAARTAERVVAAAEQALTALEGQLGRALTAEERTAYAVAFGGGLAALEDGGGLIEGTANDV